MPKKELAIVSFNHLCDEISIVDSLRALMPNAVYINPACEGAIPKNVFIHASAILLDKTIPKNTTVILPFINKEFMLAVQQTKSAIIALTKYLNYLKEKNFSVVVYVPDKNEFLKHFTNLNTDINEKILDMKMFDTESYMQHMRALNAKAELNTTPAFNKSIASSKNFPTQNIEMNTVIHSLVFLLFLYMLRIALKSEKKHAPSLR